jgi:ABC-2 type transport system permease protein
MDGFAALLIKDLHALCNIRKTVKQHSSFKVLVIILFAVGFTAGLFVLFVDAFRFLESLGGVGLIVINRLFSLFFFGLGLLVMLSSMVTAYNSLFRSYDIAYLMRQPVNIRDIVLHKYLGSTWLSSWAFCFIIIPFVGAYAWHEDLQLIFALWTLLYAVPFVLLYAALGALIVLLFIRWRPRGRYWLWYILPVLLLVLWGGWHYFGGAFSMRQDTAVTLSRLIPGLRLASFPLWPSWWVSEGIIEMSRGHWTRGIMLWVVLFSNWLFLVGLLEWVGSIVYYDAWQRVQHAGGRRRRRGILLNRLDHALHWLPGDVHAVIIKDIRVFLRDPAQWTQSIFFFGLLGLYFANLRNMNYHHLPDTWKNLIAFLNVFSVAAVLSSLGCRFVYPQLSLEGHSFWVLGLSPSSMGRILMAKFGLALMVMLAVCGGLMSLSVNMLRVDPLVKFVSLAESLGVACAVAGLSMGLGAIFADLEQRNPAAIVSSFGGTLNLVLSLSFIMVTLLPFAVVFHAYRMGHINISALYRNTQYAAVWLVCVSLLTTALPLYLGRRSLMKREY